MVSGWDDVHAFYTVLGKYRYNVQKLEQEQSVKQGGHRPSLQIHG